MGISKQKTGVFWIYCAASPILTLTTQRLRIKVNVILHSTMYLFFFGFYYYSDNY
jgi:hypothetical protein